MGLNVSSVKICFVTYCVAVLVPGLVHSIIWDYDCLPIDCSQGKRNYPGDEDFICQIGLQKECDIAQNIKLPRTTKVNPNIVKLGHVGLYAQRHDKYPSTYPALNISVVLPNSDKRALDVAMVMVNFRSQSGTHNDEFYYNLPRCLLFDFSTSKLTKIDLQHPREISYPCLVGLSTEFPKHYTINLTDLPFATVTSYSVTTYSYVRQDTCITASAIAVLQPTKTIHVVFESLSGGVHTVRLYLKKNSSVIDSFNIAGNQHEFTVRESGEYRVGIEPFQSQTACPELLTDLISCPGSPKLENVVMGTIEQRSDMLAVPLVLGLALLVVLISCTIILIRGRKPYRNSPNHTLIPLTTFYTSVNPSQEYGTDVENMADLGDTRNGGHLNFHQDQENTRVKTVVDCDAQSDIDGAQGNEIDEKNMSSGDHLNSYQDNTWVTSAVRDSRSDDDNIDLANMEDFSDPSSSDHLISYPDTKSVETSV
ncbi:hypothetical protein SNE40_010805 [Patella caerulea]|uniref:Uncharacterized protein n=1 Tax=Patella caerulea TaxID=87958 RepID=A0AAN8PV62_PATCE